LIFKVTYQDISLEPWKKMKQYLRDVKEEDFSGWFASYYIAVGVKIEPSSLKQLSTSLE
jgi:hypothetical protein